MLNALEGNKTGRYPDTDPAAVPGEYVSSGPVDSSTYGPEESSYGTQGDTIPALEDALWQKGTWGTPVSLSFDSTEVSAAKSPEGDKLAVLTRYRGLPWYSYTLLSLRRFENGAWLPNREFIFCWLPYAEFRVVWTGTEMVIVAFSLWRGTLQVGFGRRGAQGWQWSTKSFEASWMTAFTAISWDAGCIDAFVATPSKILTVTWIDGAVQAPVPLEVGRTINSMEALNRGDGHIDLLFLGQLPTDTDLYWLHHLHLLHEDRSSQITQSPLKEVRQLKGHQVSACLSTPTRIDALIMRDNADATSTNQGIWHGWYDGTWKLGTELVSQKGGDALVAVSRGDGRVHAFWYDNVYPSAGFPNPLSYRRFDDNQWQPLEPLQPQRLYVNRQALSVILDGTSPIDLFLASYDGLLHLKKVSDATRQTVEQKGLRGLISSVVGVQQQLLGFIQDSTARADDQMEQIRQGMTSSSTEASRLAVSATLGGTLVDSPLATRVDSESYLTRFIPRGRREYIRLSDAMEALQDATTTRHELTVRFFNLIKQTSGLDVRGMILRGIAQVSRPNGIRVAVLAPKVDGTPTKVVMRDDYLVTSLLESQALLDEVLARIDEEPEAIGRALAATHSTVRWAESDYFSTSIKHLENMRYLLRDLERRARNFTLPVDAYKDTLALIEGYWAELDKRLKVVDGEVAEGRQDVGVARALMAEELLRLDGINQRRRLVFDQHVPFLVFQRPRLRDLTVDVPSRVLDPGLTPDILPEVFASTEAAPPELLAYVELVRDSPLEWFSFAPSLLRKLDRIELVQRTFVRAQVRAIERVPIKLPFVPGRPSSRFFLGMSRLVDAREELIASRRKNLIRFEPAILQTQSWLELQQSAHAQLSLDDLIDMSHGRADVGNEATTELEHISKVATGLYQRFGEVLPVIRLEWAEQMSQYDAPVDLQDLSHLPNWDQIDVTDRREMQMLVDWLFQRVESSLPEAVSLMNDLVRLCMLLASHAPVNELLSGHVSKPTVAKVGGTLELAVDPSRVRVGMHVRITAGDQVVEAVVEDLSTGIARARVLSSSSPTVHLPERSSAQFIDPARRPSIRPLQSASEWW